MAFRAVQANAAGRGCVQRSRRRRRCRPHCVQRRRHGRGRRAAALSRRRRWRPISSRSLMATLPSNRTIDAVLLMAPAVHADGPARRLYDQRRAVVRERLHARTARSSTRTFGDRADDARTSRTPCRKSPSRRAGVSAEYGRFSGGMANAVTKSGGNTFSGSFRTSFANDYWRSLHAVRIDAADPNRDDEAQSRQDRADLRSDVRRAGGERAPVVFRRDAHQRRKQTARRRPSPTFPTCAANDEKRYEGKLTYTARAGSFGAGVVHRHLDQVLTNFSTAVDTSWITTSLTDAGAAVRI